MTMPPAGLPTIDASDAAAGRGRRRPAAPLIVDVRERDEFVADRAHGAVLVPMSEFAARHEELPKDRPLFDGLRRRQPLGVRDDVPAPERLDGRPRTSPAAWRAGTRRAVAGRPAADRCASRRRRSRPGRSNADATERVQDGSIRGCRRSRGPATRALAGLDRDR